MKFFIGAKNRSGQVIVAEIIDATHFHEAVKKVERMAEDKVGRGKFSVTAVNEQLEIGSQASWMGSRTAEFLGARE
jgi:hypothetical protein